MSRAAGAVLTLFLAPGAWAGVVFQIESVTSGAEVQPLEIAIEDGKMAVTGDAEGAMIYDGAAQSMLAISHSDKAYMVIDKAAAERLAAQISPVLEQLERMPPAQRAQIEKMTGTRLPGAKRPPAETKLVDTGRSDTVSGFDCVWWEAKQNGLTVREMCVTPKNEIPGGGDVMAVLSEMSEFYEDVFAQFSGAFDFEMTGNPFADVRNMDGLPVKTRTFRGNELESETVIMSATETAIGPKPFQPPEGYERRSIGG